MMYLVRHALMLFLISFIITACSPRLEPEESQQGTKLESDLVYARSLNIDGDDYLLDIYAKGEGENKPIVVFVHGIPASKDAHVRESTALAEGGALVFTITWPTFNTDLAWQNNGRDFREMGEVLGCAFRFARNRAKQYGGDPSKLIVVAFSGGARVGFTSALAGDDLFVGWDDLAAKRGGPSRQADCIEDAGSAEVDAFVGIGGRYWSFEYLKGRDAELWNVVSPYAYIGRNPNLKIRLIVGKKDNTVSPQKHGEFASILSAADYDAIEVSWEGPHIVPTELTTDIVFELVGE